MDNRLAKDLKAFRQAQNVTQAKLAEELGIKRSRYANFEAGLSQPDSQIIAKLQKLGFQTPIASSPTQPKSRPKQSPTNRKPKPEVGPPLIPASQLLVPVPSIGFVAASDKVDWTDPFESESFEFVPPEMGDARGRFACKVASDSMMPLLEPGDTLVFQKSDVPRLGYIILFRSNENTVTVKKLAHDGTNYVLKPLNPRYQDNLADGTMLGYLVGIVREKGTLRTTVYDASGILP